MNDLLQAALEVQSFCDARGWRSCVIGGLAVLRWGEPRVTRDVDLTLMTGFGNEAEHVDALLKEFAPRIESARQLAREARMLILNSSGGIGIDISLGALPFEELAVQRSSLFSFAPGIAIRTCSAEDLIVMKLFASRPIDLRDAETIVIRSGPTLDWKYMEEQLTPLAEIKDPSMLAILSRLKTLLG